jgi:hypothetical protein
MALKRQKDGKKMFKVSPKEPNSQNMILKTRPNRPQKKKKKTPMILLTA